MSFKLILKTPPIQTDALSLKKRLVNIIILNPYLEFYVLSEDMKCFPAFLVDRVDKSIALVFSQKSVSLNFNFFIANTDLVIDTQNKGAATIKELSVKDLSFSVSDCAFSISQMRFRRYDSIQTCFCLCESGDIFDHCNECFHFLMYNEEVIDIIHDRLIDATRVSNEWFFFDNVFFQFDFTINICNILKCFI